MRDSLLSLITSITPFDELEQEHQLDALEWIRSGADLYRIQKPDIPPKHLVSYFVVFDPDMNQLLLQHHLLAKRWLPPGGHVDPDEDPTDTVRRECIEELGIEAVFLAKDAPHFITVTPVVDGAKRHVDVSLWYALKASTANKLTIEPDKFSSVTWWDVKDILSMETHKLDPHLHRFIAKAQKVKIF